ncbi:set5 [Symbiodinium necroappetens]|uniref:Set5 protein n=1 Tax=Symbiodinium necroappetens TaxID=1628268 RepID=A0A812WES0_9DINO|nr:set5 [Symbiodinium necroappetens]
MEGRIKELLMPVQEAVEGSWFAKLMLLVLLSKAPEPSPLVILLAAIMVWSPPESLWLAVIDFMPKLAIPSVDPTGQGVTVALALWAMFVVTYFTNGTLLLAVEKLFPQLVGDYRIQTLKSSSRPTMSALWQNLARTSFVVLPLLLAALIPVWQRLRMPSVLPGPWEMFVHIGFGVIVNEVLFFYGHWLMHANKFLYRPGIPSGGLLGDIAARKLMSVSRYCIEEVDGKGLGIIAKLSLEAGDLVFAETPQLTFETDSSQSMQKVKEEFQRMPSTVKEEIMSLEDAWSSRGRKTLRGIIETNGIECEATGRSSNTKAVCLNLSRLNHSCNANCDYSWNERDQQMEIYAQTAISEGQLAVSLQLQQMFHALAFCEKLRIAKKLLKLYKEEDFAMKSYKLEACQFGYDSALELGDIDTAPRFARLGLRCSLICHGRNHDTTKEWMDAVQAWGS